MFGNDHLLWMLESHLDAIASKTGGGAENGVPTDASTKVTKSRLCAQMSLDPVGDAEAATVDGVKRVTVTATFPPTSSCVFVTL
jgi:hypothetical protein